MGSKGLKSREEKKARKLGRTLQWKREQRDQLLSELCNDIVNNKLSGDKNDNRVEC